MENKKSKVAVTVADVEKSNDSVEELKIENGEDVKGAR